MKQINGTFTLSFVEEDNKQRVIFRVVPLSTREGVTFRGAEDIFPDEASLRVVPDKREQSTFKERMRAMGSLCLIDLTGSEGKELVKVRQNKNYDPKQGELNQFAIYSDVVMEFAPGAVFEVLDWQGEGALVDVDALLTKEVLLLSNKVLYGPVPCHELQGVQLSALKPFGNDHFLLHTIELSGRGVHSVYWNPEETISWRQRRGSLRRKGDKNVSALEEEGFGSVIPESEEKEEKMEAFVATLKDKGKHGIPVMDASDLSEEAPVKEAEDSEKAFAMEESLPIGKKLDILAAHVTFDEHINRLDQPVSAQANRLDGKQAIRLEELREASVRVAGTPLMRDSFIKPRTVSRPEPLHQVVEQQLRAGQEERIGGELKSAQLERVENPVESLLTAVDRAWQNSETREQAVSALIENDGFVASIAEALRKKGQDIGVVGAAYAQLTELEAERFAVLLQLEKSKADLRNYKEEVLASVTQKKREELEQLTQEIATLKCTKESLENTLQDLSAQGQGKANEWLAERLTCLGGVSEKRVFVSPMFGKHQSVQDMVQCVQARLNARGFILQEDDVISFLIAFAQFPALCLMGSSLGNAQLFAVTVLEALSLQNVSTVVRPGVQVEVVSLLPEDEHRTPTVTLQTWDTQALNLFGHRTLFLADGAARLAEPLSSWQAYPILTIPTQHPQSMVDGSALPALAAPAALSSFLEFSGDAIPMLEEGEKWFEELKTRFQETQLAVPDSTLLSMRRFVTVASQKSRGGFLDAADRAVSQWVLPGLLDNKVQPETMESIFRSLPRCLQAAQSMLS